jgi:hypothetical protein
MDLNPNPLRTDTLGWFWPLALMVAVVAGGWLLL